MAKTQPKLGIIAGGGVLPAALADACVHKGIEPIIVGLAGHADSALCPRCALWARLGAVGAILRTLHKENVRELVLIGSVKRPGLAEIRPDAMGLRLLARLGLAAWRGGDDALLSALRKALEGFGFTLRGAQDFLPTLLAPVGVLTRRAPNPKEEDVAKNALHAALALGALDAGQAAIVQGERILALEGPEGTTAAIERAGHFVVFAGAPVVVAKCAKPVQDRALDMPTIGPQTVQACADAHMAGIAIESGGVLIADLQETVETADRAGLFIVGYSSSSPEP